VAKKRGNPNWGKPEVNIVPYTGESSFEEFVRGVNSVAGSRLVPDFSHVCTFVLPSPSRDLGAASCAPVFVLRRTWDVQNGLGVWSA
jgi:hypothetical protein